MAPNSAVSHEFSHKVNKQVLNGLYKFQVDTPINARFSAVQSWENLHTFILRQPYWWAIAHFPMFCNRKFSNSFGL